MKVCGQSLWAEVSSIWRRGGDWGKEKFAGNFPRNQQSSERRRFRGGLR
ncbi:hypothetical protein RUMHYD_00805 [Blautia hydrogenotrophica DSM 10507]|uniref:Uncharacterized protein n=1 Tax=Blautia hydrogenotrophica (strain DSM 10507 / JCM 14656 / S5a33) TaxID=476272 RepID=C0CIY8_BLAHS|nr:hypothetical protein RUMHYD_00805 [Blautia hydrogenotrophica DSM 10507]